MELRRRQLAFVGILATLFVASLGVTSPAANARGDHNSNEASPTPTGSKTWTVTDSIGPSDPTTTGQARPQSASMATDQAATLYVQCTLWIDDPHYSTGAPGVISKIRYSCTGNTTGELDLSGELFRWKAGDAYWQVHPRAINADTRAVGPGISGTMYIPPASASGIYCSLTNYYFSDGHADLYAGGPGDHTYLNSNTTWGPANRTCS